MYYSKVGEERVCPFEHHPYEVMGVEFLSEHGFNTHGERWHIQEVQRAWRYLLLQAYPLAVDEVLFFQALYECRPIHLHRTMKWAFDTICPTTIIPDLQNLIFQFIEESGFSYVQVVDHYKSLLEFEKSQTTQPTLTLQEQQTLRNWLPKRGVHLMNQRNWAETQKASVMQKLDRLYRLP